jgi:tetratricopeptide (TPR) repeat protein
MPLKKQITWTGGTVVFLISLGLLAYGWLTLELDRAQKAFSQGDLAGAMAIYARVEGPFQNLPWLTQIVAQEHRQASLNQVAIHYSQRNYADALTKLEQLPAYAPALAESADYSFWMGNVLFRQALESKDPETVANALKSAMSEYQRGLAAQPDDWDLKFNFELVRNILAQPGRDRKAQEQKIKSIIDKMRPQDPSRQQVAPEKRG